MKKVAIVILNWNGRKLMEEFLPFRISFLLYIRELALFAV